MRDTTGVVVRTVIAAAVVLLASGSLLVALNTKEPPRETAVQDEFFKNQRFLEETFQTFSPPLQRINREKKTDSLHYLKERGLYYGPYLGLGNSRIL